MTEATETGATAATGGAGGNVVVLSVRGEAMRIVPPDQLTVRGAIRLRRESKGEALTAVAQALRSATDGLASLGGAPLSTEAGRPELGWITSGAVTSVEYEHDFERNRQEPTGRHFASVELVVRLRDFDAIEPVGRVLVGVEAHDVHQVSWEVDEDNPAWAAVRADAIRAAIHRGRDYAQALGASVDRIVEIADAGLLGGADHPRAFAAAARGALRRGGGHEEGIELPSLEPEPQELRATVEARLWAAGVDLGRL